MEEQEEARWHQLLNAHRTRKILPYCDEQFDEYRDNSVQEFRFVLSQGIREQIFYASFVKNIEKHIKSNHTINALKQVIRYQGEYSCAMKSHFRKFGNQMSGSGNHLCNYASLLA